MADIHIEEFFRDTAIVLVQLYNAFPRKTTLFVEDIAGPDEPDEFGLHSRRHMACFGTMLWLAEEGHLRYETTISQDAIDQVVLTQSTFTRMSAAAPLDRLPVAITEELNHSEQIPPAIRADYATSIHLFRKALKSGHSTRIADTVQGILFHDSTAS